MNSVIRKSDLLRLSFPYDWSNGNIGDDALIACVIERGIFEDLCRICGFYGQDRVRGILEHLDLDKYQNSSLRRMMLNIEEGFALAENRFPPG